MPRVYVINRAAHDFSDAERFGELVFCTEGEVDKFDVSQMFRELSTQLKNSEADDFILLTSLTSLCSVACSIFAAKHQQLNLLLFKGDGYISRSLFFNNVKRKTQDAKLISGNR